jgi:pyruvate carboxylase
VKFTKHLSFFSDLAIASMADTTSQASLNAFLAAMEGHPRDPGIPFLSLEKLDIYWSQVRTLYQPFESGLKCG